MTLSSDVALVTGAAQGLGRAIALALANSGCRIVVADINAAGAEQVAAEISVAGGDALAVHLDVSDVASVQAAMQATQARFGKLSILVNCAVFAKYGPLAEVATDVLDRMFAVGLKGALLMTKAAVEPMRKAGGGTVINISSVVALTGIAYSSAYATVKGGLDAMTRALAVELGPMGIRVNSLAPSAIPSAMSNSNLDANGWEERRRRTALGRIGSQDDVAAAALFLASPAASFLTGVVLPVDGGFSIAGMVPGVDLATVGRTRG
ncbi:SDR family NAD(P)-dependent oxidoreductase [Bordetella sp. BOR01]|uniref:SDR family NAD(P)-dependent oxidoreductase n=1 Tax=Bordetella sp. BOR01 TaxID=2854779 RepID=UPI001C48B304|nr:SDR family NAD(P)-dependent oxidoreductase [Bordetella sp. BOR01]MBV7483673.1 SDR family oxidoreductase [Bordetella sp. BOR01]